MDGLQADEVCTSSWSEWGIDCELEDEHAGPHNGYSNGKVAVWGGGYPSHWMRA